MPIQGYVLLIGAVVGAVGAITFLVALVRGEGLWARSGAAVALIGLAMVIASFLGVLAELGAAD